MICVFSQLRKCVLEKRQQNVLPSRMQRRQQYMEMCTKALYLAYAACCKCQRAQLGPAGSLSYVPEVTTTPRLMSG